MKEALPPPKKPGSAIFRALGSTVPAISRTPERILAARSMNPATRKKTPAERDAARGFYLESGRYDLTGNPRGGFRVSR